MAFTFFATLLLGLTVGLAERCRPDETKPLADYGWAVEQAGHAFVDLRATDDPAKVAGMVSQIDVLMLSGGEDVNPQRYGCANTHSGKPNDRRDAWEIALVREAVRQRKGVVGICRGCQLVNVALGGTLCQDVPTFYGNKVLHDELAGHDIAIVAGSRLAGLLGTNATVNSWHHQCVERPASGLRVVARTADGVAEAFEHETLPIAGCQFHPEIMLWNKDKKQPVFQMFARLDKWLGLDKGKAK